MPFTSATNGQFGYGRQLSSKDGQIVTNGLLIHYDSGNRSSYPGSGTTWTDLTGSGKNATLVNGPTYNSANSGYLSFLDTAFQYATFADLGNLSQWTIEAWTRTTASLSGKVTSIVSNQYDLSTKLNFSLGTNNAPGSYSMSVGYFNGAWRTTTGFAPTLNVWYQVVGTNSGTLISEYKNGIVDTTLTYTGTSQSGGLGNRIARRWDDSASVVSNFYKGDISIIRIYNRALSAAEILQNYNANKWRYGL